MTLSSTLNPNAVVFCVSPFAVDIPEFVKVTFIFLLLSNDFCLILISFLRTVAFTTTFDADAVVKFCINKVWPLFDIVTWSEVNGSIVPLVEWTEYLSSSKV